MKLKNLLIIVVMIFMFSGCNDVSKYSDIKRSKKVELFATVESDKASNVAEVNSRISLEEESADSETTDFNKLTEAKEFPIEHTANLSSVELSPDSPFQKLLATGDVEITDVAQKCTYIALDSVRSIIPEFKGKTYNNMKEKFDSLILSEV